MDEVQKPSNSDRRNFVFRTNYECIAQKGKGRLHYARVLCERETGKQCRFANQFGVKQLAVKVN
jgi:hypothetical protein